MNLAAAPILCLISPLQEVYNLIYTTGSTHVLGTYMLLQDQLTCTDKGVFRTGGVVERLPLEREPNPNPNPKKSFERDLKLLSRSCTEHYS